MPCSLTLLLYFDLPFLGHLPIFGGILMCLEYELLSYVDFCPHRGDEAHRQASSRPHQPGLFEHQRTLFRPNASPRHECNPTNCHRRLGPSARGRHRPARATGTRGGLYLLARVFRRAWIIHQPLARVLESIGRRRQEASRVENMDPAHTRVNGCPVGRAQRYPNLPDSWCPRIPPHHPH